MVATAKTITIEPESETARLLDEARQAPLVLEVRGIRYVVQREGAERPEAREEASENELGPEWAAYDPERVLQVLDEMSGKWAERDIDGMIEEIYRARVAGLVGVELGRARAPLPGRALDRRDGVDRVRADRRVGAVGAGQMEMGRGQRLESLAGVLSTAR